MTIEDFTTSEWLEVKEFEEVNKLDPKVFRNDPEDCKLNFVRIFHDFTWKLGVVIKGLKSKKSYDVILLDYDNEDPEDSMWKMHEMDKNNYARSYALGQELISKIRVYLRKEDTEEWFVTCKINPPSRVKTIGYVSMILKDKSIPVKMEMLNIH